MIKKIKLNPYSISVILLVLVIVLLLVGGKLALYQKPSGKILSSQTAATKALQYINTNLLKGQPGATLKGTTTEHGLYKLQMTIGSNEVGVYVTQDGKFLFPIGNNIPLDLDAKP